MPSNVHEATSSPLGASNGREYLSDIDTPALVLDRTRLDRNIAAMQAQVQRLGVALRPP